MNLKLRTADVRFILFILVILLLTFSKSFAANRTASVSGNWSSTATWGGSSVPVAGDAVTINSGVVVTVDVNSACTSINFTAPSANNGITISGTNSLTVSGACTMNRPSSDFNTQFNINAGSCTLGSLAMGGSSSSRNTTLNITTGSCTISGNLTTATHGSTAGQIINLTSTGSVTFTGTLVTITLNATTGTVTYNSAGSQNIVATTYNNLTIGGSGTKSLAGTSTVSNDLTINSGVTFSQGSRTLTLRGDLINNGTHTISSGAITISGTLDQSIKGFITTGTVSMTKTAGTATFTSNVSGGAFTLNGNGGTLNLGSGLTHTFTGTFTRTNGTLNGGSSTINIGGTTSGTGGSFTASTSTVNYSAAGSQTIFPFNYYNLSISTSGTKTINAATTVSNELDVNAGTLATGGFLTLTSTATNTARLGTATGTITGNVTVQRFIPGGADKRKWRFLSSPVNVSGSIALSQIVDDILITAPAGSAAGFDVNTVNPANTASLRTYDESVTGASSNGWVDPTNITNTVSTGKGMEVFVRGTRSLTDPYLNWTTPDDVTIDYVGTFNTGSISPTITYTPSVGGATTADGFNLVGNPYASSIDFTNNGLTLTNVDDKFWSYNPNTGSYGIYDAGLADSTNSITRYIASGQAFFIRANAASPIITFTEAIKVAATGNNYFKGNASQATHAILRMKISNDSLNADEALVVLDESASCNTGDVHDAGKLFNDALNLYTVSDDHSNLTINALPCIKNVDTINVSVFSYNGANIMTIPHHFEFSGMSTFPSTKYIYLKDEYTNTLTNLNSTSTYDFNITTDAASWGNTRFKLLFANSSLGLNTNQLSNTIELFPNPASTEINLKFNTNSSDDHMNYQVIDLLGKVILEGTTEIQNQLAKINIELIPSGQYILRSTTNSSTNTTRFVK